MPVSTVSRPPARVNSSSSVGDCYAAVTDNRTHCDNIDVVLDTAINARRRLAGHTRPLSRGTATSSTRSRHCASTTTAPSSADTRRGLPAICHGAYLSQKQLRYCNGHHDSFHRSETMKYRKLSLSDSGCQCLTYAELMSLLTVLCLQEYIDRLDGNGHCRQTARWYT